MARTVPVEYLHRLVAEWQQRDPELHEELKARLPKTQGELQENLRALGVSDDDDLADDAGVPNRKGRAVLETIVQPTRPVLLIQNNQVTLDFMGPDSQVWSERLSTAAATLNGIIPSVGRVEVDNHPDYTWLGTGWVVDDGLLVTNRHVAREFARAGAQGFVFRSGLEGRTMGSTIDFLEEYERASSLTFGVDAVLWIAPPDLPDVAFLRMSPDPTRRLPPALRLSEQPKPDAMVVTIGYPARDSRIPDQELVKKIFGDVYEKKRLAPGQITDVRDEQLEHDCSTLGGNSGSPVVELATGEVVGLHFSGLFREANYAVSAPRVAEFLHALRAGELVRAPVVNSPAPAPQPAAVPQSAPTVPTVASSTTAVPCANGTVEYASRFLVPFEVVLRVGVPGGAPGCAPGAQAVVTGPVTSIPGVPTVGSPAAALAAAREALSTNPDVIDVRLGYRFRRGWITDEPVVVVELREKVSPRELKAAGVAALPTEFLGIGVDVRTAGLQRQLDFLGVTVPTLEARGGAGAYVDPPDLKLERVRAHMKAVFHVSPDSGFPNLKAFLSRVKRRLTATMYEWEADYISDAIEAAMQHQNATLKMVTQKKTPAGGTASAVADMQSRIGNKFKHVWASVGSGGLIPSAYHIKVASRDGEELWLSSGNWKGSNQPNIDPAGDNATVISPLRKFNRDWHVTLKNDELADIFQKYIEYDFEEAQRVPLEEGLEPTWPELFVPEEVFLEALERPEVKYFDPLEVDKELDVQPLLTPDRGSRRSHLFIHHATEMVKAAQERIFVQNQSFALLGEDKNQPEFETFFSELLKKQQAGLDVRIIFRDPREFSGGNDAPLQQQLERLQDFGFDTSRIKVQKRLHTKGVIIDESQVLLGSQNLTNAGALFNRDASLRVRDAQVTKYFAEIFLYDWDVLAVQSADESVARVELAAPGVATPVGFRRVSAAVFFGLD